MAILLEPDTKSTSLETDPLLAPPPYAPSPPAAEHQAKPTSPSSKWLVLRRLALAVLCALALLLATKLLFRSTSRSDENRKQPPESDNPISEPPPWPPAAPYDPSPSPYPDHPFFHRILNYTLPLSSDQSSLFLHAYGEDAKGSVVLLESGGGDGQAIVQVDVVYASEQRLAERVRIVEAVGKDGARGIDILVRFFLA